MLNTEATNIEATEARVLDPQGVVPTRPMPSIVWRSSVKPHMSLASRPRRLHLVTTTPIDRVAMHRRQRVAIRTRVVEGAYIAAALGTAVVLWWSAR